MTYNKFTALHHRNVHVVSGRTDIFELLVGEDVESNKVHFGVAVLTSLRGAHFNNLNYVGKQLRKRTNKTFPQKP